MAVYRSIFISDLHLGTKFSRAELLLDFFKENESENLYLIGDIIDGWAIKRRIKWAQSHSDVIQKILRKARKGTHVYFIVGNHDDFLRPFLPLMLGDRVYVDNQFDYMGIDDKSYLVTHGDLFDSITMTKKWLAIAGDYGYSVLLNLNGVIDTVRKIFGINRYWSLSKYVKDNVKKSASFISNFEGILAEHAGRQGYDGVICGHIHKAEIRQIGECGYINSGDWVESCTAVAETLDGRWIIIDWLAESNDCKNATGLKGQK